jgi:tetratricopeptide (TPR) repeat protein
MEYASRLVFVGAFLLPCVAFAQTTDLDRARATFTEAMADQEAKRYAVALDKYRRVAEVRDTAQVEYRIGSCLESLGERRAALVAYDHAAHLGRGDAQAQDVVASANQHIAALATDMGKLGIVVRGSDAPDIRVDGTPATADELDSAIVLEPGNHVVEVTAPMMKPARANVTLVRGKKLDLTIDLVAEKPVEPPPLPPPPPLSHRRQYIGIVLVSAGAAFAIGAGASLFVRNDLIDTIKFDCPGNVCLASQRSDIEGMRSTASALAPLAAVLGGVALACAGLGVAFIVMGPTTVGVRGQF